ncbi:Qat anti-phage system TatD family nuclease QatD [Muricoccus radiodurans]|uniref:Qat anti-phage system TatD family nuclease QatD n=1 Tax=Muricoccus radiodurans TaxID=2231721 RepID=UPI003CF9F097
MIDFHCHLDLYPDPRSVVAAAREQGHHVLSVTTTPKAWRGTAALAQGVPRIRTALGLHPQIAHERHGELALFEGLLPETRYVGEVGLDGSPELRPHQDVQRRCFDRILRACAKEGGRVMTVHSRRAADAVLDAFESAPGAGIMILYWFSGSRRELDRAVRLGCWFSVGPAMVRSQRGRDLLAAMPRDRVLTETDGPFASGRDGPLQPGEVSDVVAACQAIWGILADQTAHQMADNLRRLGSMALPN